MFCFSLQDEEGDSEDDPPSSARERLLKSTDVERLADQDASAAMDSYAYNIKGLHPQTRYF